MADATQRDRVIAVLREQYRRDAFVYYTFDQVWRQTHGMSRNELELILDEFKSQGWINLEKTLGTGGEGNLFHAMLTPQGYEELIIRLKVFVSYSQADFQDIREVVAALESDLERECDFTYWQKSKQMGEKDWESIFRWISDSDVVLAFIIRTTDGKTVPAIERSLAVGTEIGYALAHNKYIIPIVHPGVERDRLAAIKSITSARFDHCNPFVTLEEVVPSLKSYAHKKNGEK